MQSLATGVKAYLGSLGPEAAKMMRVQQIKDRYRAAVERTWRDNPAAIQLVLAHTNGMYVQKDERLRTGPDKHKDRIIFGVYLDDPIVRTEFDARQQMLGIALRREGMSFDELRILPAKWDMRHRRAFPEALGMKPEAPVSSMAASRRSDDEEVKRLDTLKRAFCLVFEDTEQAWAVLEQIEGAGFDLVRDGADDQRRSQAFWCHLYVEDTAAMKAVLDRHGAALKSKARDLGLRVRAFAVHRAPAALSGQCAFRRAGRSVPLRMRPLGTDGEAVSAQGEAAE